MHLFGKAAVKPVVDTRSSIASIRDTISMIEKRERHFQTRIDKETEVAKALSLQPGKKQQALVALKRRKMYQTELDKMMMTRSNLEVQSMALENASFNVETLAVMKRSANAMAALSKSTDVDKVEQAMIGMKAPNLTGGMATMGKNHHLSKPVLIGEIQDDGQFDVVWETEGLVAGDAWSDFLPDSKDLIADWTAPIKCGNYNTKTKKCSSQNY